VKIISFATIIINEHIKNVTIQNSSIHPLLHERNTPPRTGRGGDENRKGKMK
jgi:hypothetical protein